MTKRATVAERSTSIWASIGGWLRGIVFGRPLASSVHLEHRLPIYLALPVFASDALSSVAYATQEILVAFRDHDAMQFALHNLPWISIAIAVLIVIVSLSYRQAIHLYPSGGGSYTVSRDNLGVLPGLVAAAALIVDYILTVAVSVSSGVENLTSAAQFLNTNLHIFGAAVPVPILIALLLVAFITLMNLRGTRESGWWFALPAYAFFTMITMVIIATIYRYMTGNFTVIPAETVAHTAMATGGLGFLLILRAFASGCSALTGVEAVSNGVSAFEPPEAKNAAKTLLVLMCMLVFLFIGVGGAAILYHALPYSHETTISQVARMAFGGTNLLYWMTTFATLSVLMIAANTSFAGFPRLLAIVAKDGYAPKSFASLGDRLVHNQGIIFLTALSVILIIIFKAKTSALIPLYAVGVFICFTLSQLGMVNKVRQMKEKGWRRMMAVNLFGAMATGAVAIIQAVTKFTEGAWMVVLVLPIIVTIYYLIHRHYKWFDETMTVHPYDYNPLADPAEPLTVLVLVSSDIHRGILEGLECGRSIAEGRPNSILRAVHIEMDEEKTVRLRSKWEQFVEPYLGKKIRLDIVPSPYRWLIEPVMEYLDRTDLERTGDRVIIVLPEFETGNVLTHFLHNFTGRRLREALLNRPHVTVVSSRFFMKPMAWRIGRGGLVY